MGTKRPHGDVTALQEEGDGVRGPQRQRTAALPNLQQQQQQQAAAEEEVGESASAGRGPAEQEGSGAGGEGLGLGRMEYEEEVQQALVEVGMVGGEADPGEVVEED